MDIWFSHPEERDFRGLRAGWRLAVFLIILLAPVLLLRLAAAHTPPHAAASAASSAGAVQPLSSSVSEAIALAWLLFATFILARLERRAFGDFGLPARQAFHSNFWRGVAWGVVSLTLLLVLIFASGDYSFGHIQLGGARLLEYALGWAAAFLVVGFFEEFCFRGYALTTLTGGMGFWPSAVLLSCLFGALHLSNAGEGYLGALSAGLIGLFFCFTWHRTGSLWFAIGLHAAWDYCESFVYGVPDSGSISSGRLLAPAFHGSRWLTGGSIGPEGSLWVFVVIALLFLAFARVYPQQQMIDWRGPQRGSAARPA